MIDVFLVHDDVERCATIRAAIKSNPELNLISETQTGREGLFAAATMLTGHPRMLIVRLNLGDMTGFDFIAQVRQKAPDLYIIPALGRHRRRPSLAEPSPARTARCACRARFRRRKSPRSSPPPRPARRSASTRTARPPPLKAKLLSSLSCPPVAASASRSSPPNLAAAMAKLSDSVTLLDFSLNPGRLRRHARRRAPQ